MSTKHYFAMDYGASSGRGILGHFDGTRIELEEVGRFDNYYINVNGLYYWDAFMLLHELKKALLKAGQLTGGQIASIGIDTWGTDYGLLDKNGQLLGNARCMRNSDNRYVEKAGHKITAEELYARTGIQTIPGNTLFQLYEKVLNHDTALQNAQTLLMLPDLLSYFLTGETYAEYTIASTSMLYNPTLRSWDLELCRKLGIPEHLFCELLMPASRRIPLQDAVCEELGFRTSLVPVGSHDTASAVAAAPLEKDMVFCSSGTWSLIGIETNEPVISERARRANFSNEGTVTGGYRFLKNIMGMWILQQCRMEWERAGIHLSWDEIVEQAKAAPRLVSLIDPENLMFYQQGNMTKKIQTFCEKTGQKIPQTIGEIAICAYQSIALRYRMAFAQIEELTGKTCPALCIVGGGSKNRLLNQMAADAIGKPVYAGPVEAACVGNLLTQAIAAGDLGGYTDLRSVVRASFEAETYLPQAQSAAQWKEAAARFSGVIERFRAAEGQG